MGENPEAEPVIPLPERIDRSLRLGPFPSARDALKFLCYAAAGVLLVPLLGLPLGLAIATAGFLASAYHPGGQGWDERMLTVLRWKWRSAAGGTVTAGPLPGPLVREGLVRLGASDWAAVVRTGGIPLAFLPPAELARRFEIYRDLLRASEGRLCLVATIGSIRAAPFLPSEPTAPGPDRDARIAYSELVELLCRRRRGRRVYLVIGGRETGMDAIARLEGQVAAILDRLAALGLRPVRLRDRALAEAARRIGWPKGEDAP